MDYIFASAENNTKAQGWLGPLADGSAWSSFRYATCLGQYYEATHDKRVAAVFFKYNQVLHNFLVKTPMAIGSWTQVRWQEHVVACQWLLDAFGAEAGASDVEQTWKLMKLLAVQGFNWTGQSGNSAVPYSAFPILGRLFFCQLFILQQKNCLRQGGSRRPNKSRG